MHVYSVTYGTVVLLCVGDLREQAGGLASFKGDCYFSHL